MEFPKLRKHKITGEISIEPVTGRIPHDPYPIRYLIMGPTGAGKSSLIEALAGDSQRLSISKDQLAGYTRTVNTYRLVNVMSRVMGKPQPVYLIDTPGFSDSKISEFEIIRMVKKWLKDNDLEFVYGILFLTPITETRLPGSRRRTIEMLKQLLAPGDDHSLVTFVTTMWDTLHNERTHRRAECNFKQLRDEVCKGFFGKQRVSITRFMNTKSSALKALDFGAGFCSAFSQPESSASPSLYQDLHERIERALQVKQMLESDLAQPETQTDTDLRTILQKNHSENYETLNKFIRQFVDFGPLPAEFKLAAHHLRKSITANTMPPSLKYKLLYWQWEHEPQISDDTDASSVPSQKFSLRGLVRPLVSPPKRHAPESSKRGE